MTRLRGWAPRGQRLVDKVPQGKWKTATFLAALRNDRIDAPCLFDGPINGERFHAYVEQFLVPTLKPGDVVILDNLGSHKGKAVRTAIRDVGARLVFLPKYSPDLNPIEQVFAKFKTLLRKAGARSYQAISDACGEILAQYPPAECAAWIPERSATRLREADLNVLSKLGNQGLEWRLEPEAFTGREVCREDDLLDFLVGCPVDIQVARQPST